MKSANANVLSSPRTVPIACPTYGRFLLSTDLPFQSPPEIAPKRGYTDELQTDPIVKPRTALPFRCLTGRSVLPVSAEFYPARIPRRAQNPVPSRSPSRALSNRLCSESQSGQRVSALRPAVPCFSADHSHFGRITSESLQAVSRAYGCISGLRIRTSPASSASRTSARPAAGSAGRYRADCRCDACRISE